MSKEKQNAEIYRPMNEELFNNLEKQYQEISKVKAESEQIEKDELFSILSNTINGANFDDLSEAVYKISDVAGYRKQTEGEWREDFEGDCYCTACGYYPKKDVKNYCPDCGAKMKGGAE